jgi:hypothetical protein
MRPASQSTKMMSGLKVRPTVKASIALAAAVTLVTVRRRRESATTPRI